jgi:hypothetical protein
MRRLTVRPSQDAQSVRRLGPCALSRPLLLGRSEGLGERADFGK